MSDFFKREFFTILDLNYITAIPSDKVLLITFYGRSSPEDDVSSLEYPVISFFLYQPIFIACSLRHCFNWEKVPMFVFAHNCVYSHDNHQNSNILRVNNEES